MESREKTYIIYQITSPRGNKYVGYTSMSVLDRWRRHQYRAKKGEAIGHPFYDEIRMFPESEFKAEELARENNRLKAMQLEQKYIAEAPSEKSMNVSSGGINDAKEGGQIFWDRLNADPEKREEYLRKLSEIKKANDWSDYEKMAQQSAQWRKAHPREAYKLSYRAVRIANRKNGTPPPCYVAEDTRPLKERLMHKYKLNDIRKKNTTNAWRRYSNEKRANIAKKISKSQIEANKRKSQEEINASCANARSYIDRQKQSEAASRGLKNWWAELKKDPEKYDKYIKNRTTSLQKTIKGGD